MKIAVTGKGGVGKTTLCALLARELASQGKRVLAIDADPNANLGEALGYDEETSGRIEPLIEKKVLVEERTGTKPGSMGGYFVLNPKVDDLVERFSVGIQGLRLIVTGELKEAVGGCYCPENALLRSFLRHLMVERDEWVILDMEAGFEHMTRGTAESVGTLLIVVEPGQRAMNTAGKIASLAKQLHIRKVGYVINKVHSEGQEKRVADKLGNDAIWATIPFDFLALEADLSGSSPYDQCPEMLEKIRGLVRRLLSDAEE
ncbi:AAA family ATPase [Prosthecochloris sp. SCSIO W1103]|uniref:ATP-binding protein n=1 Tax=Prosthecochloris sp. SCSIO W1103 TaxID=2992244 RepID=UPI00223D8C18|nr:AAA family ATPase [Prosthecochloris sp. SCSIO W1103]UZJ37669.1 AAA family ATPase [Prosthecochloris sp. SCSIO W1103]